MLDLHRLILLREVRLRGTIAAAAHELSYSHSAVSQQLAILENETGVALLERAGRGVRLTQVAEELVRNTEVILAAVERAEAGLAASHSTPQGVVRVAAFATISQGILPAALSDLAVSCPMLDVQLRLADPEVAAVWLTSRQVDLVVTDAYPGTEAVVSGGVHVTTIGRDPIRGYLPDLGMDGDVARIRNVRWVMEPRTSAATQWALRVCRERGFEPVVAHESSDLLFQLRMVEAGLVAGFIPDMVVRQTGSTLVPSAWLPSDQYRSIHLLVRDGSESNLAVVAIRNAIQVAFEESLSRTGQKL